MKRHDVEGLDRRAEHWVAAVVSPQRDWLAMPGCRRGARFLVNGETLRPTRDEFDDFDSQLSCLQWIMRHRADLNHAMPGAPIRAVRLDRWLLGLD